MKGYRIATRAQGRVDHDIRSWTFVGIHVSILPPAILRGLLSQCPHPPISLLKLALVQYNSAVTIPGTVVEYSLDTPPSPPMYEPLSRPFAVSSELAPRKIPKQLELVMSTELQDP